MSVQRVAYVVSRFPKTTETFIAREMAAVIDAGVAVDVIALVRETGEIVQADAEPFIETLRAVSDLRAPQILSSQISSLLASPRRWFRMWGRAIWGNRRSLKFLARGVKAALGAPALAYELERDRIDHLHAHWGTHSALLAYLLHILTDIPYSVTLHAHDLHVERTMLGEKLGAASATVTISGHNSEIIAELYPDLTDRLHVVHCGVDVDSLRQQATTTAQATKATHTPPRIAVVAGLRDFKGHGHLLDAVAQLVDSGDLIELDLVGDGPLRQTLSARTHELGIEGLVTFHGAVEVERAIAIVRAADVAVMPSIVLSNGRRDGIPVALIEAMAVGTPVVASSVSGIPELIEDGQTGLLVAQADPAALAQAIRKVLGSPEQAAERATAARSHVEAEFDIRRSAASMIEIWNRGDVVSRFEGVQMRKPILPRMAWIVLATVVAALMGLIWGASQEDVHRAEAVVAFGPSPALTLDADVIDVISALDRGVLPETAAGLATSGSIRAEAAERIGLTTGVGQYRIDASPVFEANLLDVVARGPDAEIAANLANSIADVVSERVSSLYTVYVVEVVTRATPSDPEGGNLGLLVVGAGVLGAAMAAAVLLLLDRSDRGRDTPSTS